ncbi:FAD-dependent monooxygenase [Streptomyces sp. NPDC051662]|uniref:FAD-dependent monooxygenase n=1 Tax=Streptomyces sp. NPDC051662 TaxID=3154750 RepID=UPI00341AFBCA
MSDEPEVLIIGAGPVGLSGALALGRAGVKVLVLERRDQFSRYPKANGVHARTMELFRQWGVSQPIWELTAGTPAGVTIAWRTRLNGIEFGSLSVEESGEALQELGQHSPERLSTVGQHMFEPLLAEAADEMENVTILLSSEVVSLDIGEDSVFAQYTDTEGEKHSVTAQYVIGADGIRSIVRRTLGIGEHGQESLGTAVNVQFSAELDPYLGDRVIPLVWIANKDTQGAFLRDSPTRWRYNFDIPPGVDPATATPERCEQEILQAIGEPIPFQIHYTWTWTHDLAVADTWRAGRAFLAGDSCHHFPPHGGFGLNSGVQDIHNLAWKLVARLRWNAGDRLLDTYETERLPVAESNGELCMNNTRAMEKTGFLTHDKEFLAAIEADTEEGARVRESIAASVFDQQDVLSNHGRQFGFQYDSSAVIPDGTPIVESSIAEYVPSARPSARAPHSWVLSRGTRISTIDLYDGGFVLFMGPDNSEAWATAATRIQEELGIPFKSLALGRDLTPVDEAVSDLLARYGLEPTGALLIRPDGFVGHRSATAPTGGEHGELLSACTWILDLGDPA